MITKKHWLIAIGGALLMHACMALALLPKKQASFVVVSSSGVEVGLGDNVSDSVVNDSDEQDVVEDIPKPPIIVKKEVAVTKPEIAKPTIQPEVVEKPVEQSLPAVETFDKPIVDNVAVAVEPSVVVQPTETTVINKDQTLEPSDAVVVSSPLNVQAINKHKAGAKRGLHKNKGNGNALRGYFSDVAALIDANKDYPGEVKKEKQEGVVVVAFSINRQGKILSSSIRKSSGYALLDKAALATLQRASPFPPMPKSIKQDTLKIAVPIDYTLITN